MKIWLDNPAHANSGGMYRVFHGLYTYLPKLGIEITDDKDQADLFNPHIGLFSSFPPGKPMVVSSHGMLWKEHKWGGMADKVNRECLNAYRRADVVTAPSQFAATAIARYTGATPLIVRHGIDTDQWQPNDSKGEYVLWNKSRPDAANLPTEMNTLASLAPETMFYATHGLEADNVYIFGRIPPSDMHDLIKHTSVYLDTSKESGGPCFGILEAMACAVPTLSWDFGGTSEAIVHKETGYLAEPYNYDDLLEGLQYCIDHKQRLGANARQTVVEKYQWATVIEGYADAYQLALDGVSECSVSVVVPCYNLGAFLPHCLDSLIQQTHQDWEAVVVDDASSDNTWEIITRYSLQDSRIVGVKLPYNHHVSDARNIGIDSSIGNYVLPLDADDRLYSTALETLVRELESDRALDIAAGKLRIFHESDLEGKSIDSGWPNNVELKLQLEGFNRLPYSSMYRRKVWERLGGYRRRIRSGVEDADFWTRALAYGYNAKIIDEYTLKYTKRAEGLGNANTKGSAAWITWFPWNSVTAPANTTQVNNFNPPKVSVIIPVGPGHTKHIQACIDSLVAQTEDEWEAIVINDTGERWFDDNNKPLTYQVLGMGFVKFIDSDTCSGVAYARNRGIEAANSDKIVFLDVDDVAQAHMLKALLAAQDKVGGWIYGDWYINVGQGSIEYSEAPDWNYHKILNRSLAPITGIYEKSHLLLVEMFDEDLAGWEDWDLQLKLLHHGICGTRLKTPLITYNMHLGFRREENFTRHKDLVEYINKRHTDLRSDTMGCKSCGGGTTLSIRQKSNKQSEENMDDLVTMKYLGNEAGRNRIKSRANPSTHYTFNRNRREFYVFKSDVEWLLSMRTSENNPKYAVIEQIKHKPTEIEISEEPLVSEDVPQVVQPDKSLSVEELDLDSRIITLLANNGFKDITAVDEAPDEDLLAIRGVGKSRVNEIRQAVRAWYSSTWQ